MGSRYTYSVIEYDKEILSIAPYPTSQDFWTDNMVINDNYLIVRL